MRGASDRLGFIAHIVFHLFDQTRWVAHAQGCEVKFLRSKRGVLRSRHWCDPVSVSTGVYGCATGFHFDRKRSGRKVTIDNVRFHVLPRPGFALEGLVIYDDPDFSAEPRSARGCFRRDPVSFPAARTA